ncbi:MAG: peptide deformylase [candidate division WOR-3 bacterium]
MIKPIKIIDDPVLREKSEEIDLSDFTTITQVTNDLLDTLQSQRGLGLAAVQVGIPKRIFVINAKELEFGNNYRVFINPRINFVDGLELDEEGCLSIPGLYAEITRPTYMELEAIELKNNGKLRDVKIKTEGFLTRVFLHEIDHLDGILFIDYLDEESRRILLAKWRNEYNKHSL